MCVGFFWFFLRVFFLFYSPLPLGLFESLPLFSNIIVRFIYVYLSECVPGSAFVYYLYLSIIFPSILCV